MSQIEVDKIIPQSGTSTQLGESGDTITIPAGATITNNGTANGFGSADTEKVKVSSNDTTAGFLNGKLVAGTNISLTEGSDGGNETLTAALTGTIATAQIADDAVTLAKMAPGTDGNIISYDASGNPVAVATGSAGQILTSAGAGAPPTFATAAAGGITEADMWRTTTDTAGASGTFSSNWERVDTYSFSHLGTGMTESSGIFTFPSTGFYRISFQSNFTGTSIQYAGIILMLTTNNSSYNQHVKQYTSLGNSSYETSVSLEGIVDITNVSTHKVRFDQQQSASGGVWAGGSSNRTSATFIRLADT